MILQKYLFRLQEMKELDIMLIIFWNMEIGQLWKLDKNDWVSLVISKKIQLYVQPQYFLRKGKTQLTIDIKLISFLDQSLNVETVSRTT